ncbi:Transposase IS4 [Popillia japonica]|uniref:Transposase IS4 n=1 Tax=Popillia japonica TaxID=7064 RepID=A0AAW1MDV1_POPJA
MDGQSKRVRFGDPDFDATLLKWYEEARDSDDSDIDNVVEDHNIESEHDTNSEMSASEDPEDVDTNEVAGMDKKTRKHNIVMKIPTLKSKARDLGDAVDPLPIWNLLFNNNMSLQIMQNTNNKLNTFRERYSVESRHHVRDIDITELKAFLGLLVYTAIFNSSHENIDRLFATDGSGREILRTLMSKKRFAVLLATIRFDNPQDREERKKDDPISFVFNTFIEN